MIEKQRNFGEFGGQDGYDPQSLGNPYAPLLTGYAPGKKTRVTDRFVRYPNPKHMRSAYNQQYDNKYSRSEHKNPK